MLARDQLSSRARWLEAEALLVRLVRSESALKLRMGELLDTLFLRGGHHELGFSSIDAYVVERCQRSAAWGREARGIARRIRERSLVGLRKAMIDGAVGAAMAELVARHATHETEVALMVRAKESTVRALAAELTGRAPGSAEGDEHPSEKVSAIEWVRPRDLAAVTASRMLVEYLTNGARSDEAFVEALLGEGQGALQSIAEKRRAGGAVDDQTSRVSVDARLARAMGAVSGRGDVRLARPAEARGMAGRGAATMNDAGARDDGAREVDDARARGAGSRAVESSISALGDTSGADPERSGSRRRTRRDALGFTTRWGRAEFGSGRGPHRSFGGRGEASASGPSLEALMSMTKTWLDALAEEAPLPSTVRGLDAAIVAQCRVLARRSLAVARLLARVARSGIWSELGFANVARWAEERLGMSRSSLEHRGTLVKRLGRSPALERSVEAGEVGYESALLVSRVVGRSFEDGLAEAWIDRAKRRTYKHLREEVRAVELARAYDPEVSPLPPSDEDLQAVADFERKVQSGEVVRPYALAGVGGPRASLELFGAPAPGAPQTSVGLDPPGGAAPETSVAPEPPRAEVPQTSVAPEPPVSAAPHMSVAPEPPRAEVPQASVPPEAPAEVIRSSRPMRLHISVDLFAEWRRVEADYLALGGAPRTFVPFLCAALWETWLPFLETWDDKWKEVFRRDLHRCTSPVCARHDVTAHHVHYRAHGGSDALDNLTSGCAFCHLEAIHKGRLKAEGHAPKLTWTIGRDPILRVRGREKVELGAAS